MGNFSADLLKNTLDNPARTYLWDVLIPKPVGGGDRDALQTRCQSVTFPGRSVGIIKVPYKQSAGIQLPGKLVYPHLWKAEFVENADGKIFDALYNWAQSLVHDITNVGVGDAFTKTDIYLSLSDVAAAEWRRIQMKGVFFSEVGDVDLSYDSEGIIKFVATFAYDSWVKAA